YTGSDNALSNVDYHQVTAFERLGRDADMQYAESEDLSDEMEAAMAFLAERARQRHHSPRKLSHLSKADCAGYTLQSIGFFPCACKYSLTFEKCPLPIKPRCADSGEGCGDLSTKCLRASINWPFFCA